MPIPLLRLLSESPPVQVLYDRGGKGVLVNFARVARPERPKGAKDEVKRPVGPPETQKVKTFRSAEFHAQKLSGPSAFLVVFYY